MHIRFGTDGWRAVIAKEFTFSNLSIVAKAIARLMKERNTASRGAVVGYDARFLSPEFAQEVARILTEEGIKVYMTNRDLPTPFVAFSIKYLGAGGAIMITASHNPPIYSGIKFIPEYLHPALSDVTERIEELIEEVQKEGGNATNGDEREITVFDPFPAYKEHIQTLIDFSVLRHNPLPVAYDPLYASGRGYLEELLREAGWDVAVIHNERNPLFGGGLPDPSEEELKDLRELVVREGRKLGLSTDGDADRFGVLDEDGSFVTPNEVLAIMLKYLVEERGKRGLVVRSIATTHLLDALARHYGLPVKEVPVGFKFVGQALKEENALIGGEESGGMSMRGHIPEKDGILACLLLCEARAKWGVPLREIMRQIYETVGTFYFARLDIPFAGNRSALLSYLKEKLSSTWEYNLIEIREGDGLKFVFEDDSWLLVRPSGTEPLVRCYLEAKSEGRLSYLRENISRLLEKARDLS